MHLGGHHLFLETEAAWQLWAWRRVWRWEGKKNEEMQGEGGEAGQLVLVPVTQKALSWFNGCEVFPPHGPRSCWCLISMIIQVHTQKQTTNNTHRRTPHAFTRFLPPEFSPALPLQEMTYKDTVVSIVALYNMFSLLPYGGYKIVTRL